MTSYHTSLSAYANFYGLGLLSDGGWKFLRWFHNSGERTFCPTSAIAQDLNRRGFANTSIWARGVDCERFSPTWRTSTTRRSLGIDDREFLVTYVGRVAREKGMDTMLDGVARYRASGASPRARLLVVGDGPYLEHCRRHAPSGTLVTGRRSGDELSRLFAASDLFVFPSTTDTFGNVVLEAMASGVPVLAADCDVTREIAGDYGARFFMPSDATSLAHELQRLGCDPATRRTLAAFGRARAERLSWETVFTRLFDEYRAVVWSASRSTTVRESH